MRFKTYQPKDTKHSELVSCVAWCNSEEVFSCGDDHILYLWNLATNDTLKVTEFSADVFPTDLHLFPRIGQANKKQQTSDFFALTATDGKFYFITKHGRIEKTVEAHNGAVLAGRWSHDGSALVTVGEDGQVKIWSRSGMLRTNLSVNSLPIYSVSWSPNSDKVLHTLGRQLVIKALQPNSKPLQWKAHDGLILRISWNVNNNLIISGGEDCKYKVWDSYGQIIFQSQPNDYPITSVSWSPSGEMFAIGSFDTLRLCDKAGWSYCLEKPPTQSIFAIAWSTEGTQIAGACGNGQVIFANIIEKLLEWNNIEVSLIGRKTLSITDITKNIQDTVECRETIIRVDINYDHLVVITLSQCYIYKTNNWHTPQIIDLKGGQPTLLLQALKHFLIVDSAVYIYTYDGKVVSSPKWPGMKPENLNSQTTSLSQDVLAVRDWANEKAVYLFDTQTGKSLTDKPFIHKMEIAELGLTLCGSYSDRRMAFIDKNKDLYLLNVSGSLKNPLKLGSMVQSLFWNDKVNVLAAIQDNQLAIWYHPAIIFVDKGLLAPSLVIKESSDFGKNPTIVYFSNTRVTIRRADGALISTMMSPFPANVHHYISNGQWKDALRLCRFAKEKALWACLAGAAILAKDLSTAELAYAAIDEAAKVKYIQYIKGLSPTSVQHAEILQLCGNMREAEALLLQSNHIFRAILMNLHQYQWKRALDLATKYNSHLDIVLAYKKMYLDRMGITETDPLYLKHSKAVGVDVEELSARIEEELTKK